MFLKNWDLKLNARKEVTFSCKHPDGRATVVPIHGGENIGPGLFPKILRDTESTRNDFIRIGKK